MPVKIAVLFGDGRACSACDEPLLKAQTRYKFEFPGLGTFSFHLDCFGLYTAELCTQGWLRGRPLMLSEAAELLLAAFAPFHEGICVDCGAQALERSREESLKATQELIANGYALAGFDACALCNEVTLITRLRIPSSR
jgi:hypothetical protein